MAGKLEDVLQPGEGIIFRARLRARDVFVQFFISVAALVAITFGVANLVMIFRPEVQTIAPSPFLYLFVPAIAVIILYVLLSRGEAVVTEGRLLYRRGRVTPRISEISLSEIKGVYGLEEGSPRPIAVETTEGAQLILNDAPKARDLGRAVALAAGLGVPSASAPLAERAAKVLKEVGSWSPRLGVIVAICALFILAELKPPTFFGILAFVLAVTLVVPAVIGLLAGWFIGALLALLYLRPLVTAKEMREAIYADLGVTGSPLQTGDFRPWTRPILLRLASGIYGRSNWPSSDGIEEHHH